MKRKALLYIALLMLLTACEQAINYQGETSSPMLVMEAEMGEGDTVVACYVGRSYFFLDAIPLYPDSLTQVTVAMESSRQTLSAVSAHRVGNVHYLRLSSPLQAGDSVRLRASHPDYGTVAAEDVIVPRPHVQLVRMTADSASSCFRVRLRLSAYPDKKAVLGIRAAVLTTMHFGEKEWQNAYRTVESNDELFAYLRNAYSADDGFRASGDLFFEAGYAEGREVEIIVPANGFFSDEKEETFDSLCVTVSALTETAYRYYRSMADYLGNTGEDDTDLGSMAGSMIGIEETVPVYSNITNGYGIVAGASKQTIVIQ